jgi:hypothetical protein
MQGAARARNAPAAGWMAQASVHPSLEAQQAQPPPTTCKPLLNEPLDFKSQRNTSTAPGPPLPCSANVRMPLLRGRDLSGRP